MASELKTCNTCQKHQNKTSIDDVHSDCYPCVHAERTLGYYPSWEPIEDSNEWVEREMGWQGGSPVFMKQDNVNSPKHYTTGGIETIDFIKAKLGKEGTIAYCIGNVMKYTTRWKDKGGLEDLQKAQWYLNYAINLMKEKNASE